MATQTATAIGRRRFNGDDYYAMTRAWVLAAEEKVELLDEEIFVQRSGTRRRFSVDEFYALAEAGVLAPDERVELLAGEIITMAAIGSRHAFCVRWLSKALTLAVGDTAILDTQNPLRLDDWNQPQPDLMALRWRDDGYPELPGPEDVLLVIEVSDTTVGFDRRHKAPLYAAAGIPEMWLLDVNIRQVEIYDEPLAGGYARMRIVGMDGVLTPAAFPDIAIPVRAVMPR